MFNIHKSVDFQSLYIITTKSDYFMLSDCVLVSKQLSKSTRLKYCSQTTTDQDPNSNPGKCRDPGQIPLRDRDHCRNYQLKLSHQILQNLTKYCLNIL